MYDPPDPDAAWLRPAWDALHAAERAIAADPDWAPNVTPYDEDADDGAL